MRMGFPVMLNPLQLIADALFNHRQGLIDNVDHLIYLCPGDDKRRAEKDQVTGLAPGTAEIRFDVHPF